MKKSVLFTSYTNTSLFHPNGIISNCKFLNVSITCSVYTYHQNHPIGYRIRIETILLVDRDNPGICGLWFMVLGLWVQDKIAGLQTEPLY